MSLRPGTRRTPDPTQPNRAGPAVAAQTDGPAPALVVAHALAKTYDSGEVSTVALRGVDLQIGRGEMVAIMGPSGCGKTTLLNCLSGLEEPSGGRVVIDGTDIYALKDDPRTRFRARAMGFIFQSYNLLPVLSAEENVELPLLVTGSKPAVARARAHEALALVGLQDREHHKPQQLSGGQQQRVAIARSLVHDPPLVWADEPTGNLDAATSREVMDLMVDLNRRTGKTFVIVTHDPNVAGRCGRTIHMESGLVATDGATTTDEPRPKVRDAARRLVSRKRAQKETSERAAKKRASR